LQHLAGHKLPDVALAATDGRMINPAREAGVSVFFCYPYTGRPGHGDPTGWDDIPGAHGSTPQALGFSAAYEKYQKLAVKVFGVSFQDIFWQSEFVRRNSLRVPLLSDHARKFASALRLETFKAGTEDYLKRVTLIALNGIIIVTRVPVDVPARDAEETLKLIESLEAT
jgi:peroxiredoxin